MILCPYCRALEEGEIVKETDNCALMIKDEKRTVFLKKHEHVLPDSGIMQEAAKLLFDGNGTVCTGLIDETDVIGHWGIRLIPMKWSGSSRLYEDQNS
jgi:hypothetical protein